MIIKITTQQNGIRENHFGRIGLSHLNVTYVVNLRKNKTKMEYKFDEQSVKELMEWAQTAQLPQELELSKAERIFDVKLCIESDLSCIRAHYPDAFYNPAITRLYRIREKLEEK